MRGHMEELSGHGMMGKITPWGTTIKTSTGGDQLSIKQTIISSINSFLNILAHKLFMF